MCNSCIIVFLYNLISAVCGLPISPYFQGVSLLMPALITYPSSQIITVLYTFPSFVSLSRTTPISNAFILKNIPIRNLLDPPFTVNSWLKTTKHALPYLSRLHCATPTFLRYRCTSDYLFNLDLKGWRDLALYPLLTEKGISAPLARKYARHIVQLPTDFA